MTESPRHRLLKQVGEGFVLTAMHIQPDTGRRAKPGDPDKAIIRLYTENGSVWQSAPVSGEIQARANPDGREQGFGWFVAPEAGTDGLTISFLNETSEPVTIRRATIELQPRAVGERDEIELPLWPFTLHRDIGLTFVWQRPLPKAAPPATEGEGQPDGVPRTDAPADG